MSLITVTKDIEWNELARFGNYGNDVQTKSRTTTVRLLGIKILTIRHSMRFSDKQS